MDQDFHKDFGSSEFGTIFRSGTRDQHLGACVFSMLPSYHEPKVGLSMEPKNLVKIYIVLPF